MSEAGGLGPEDGAGAPEEKVLRAKYLDYCSARIVERLLELSADEMFVLARDAARDSGAEDAGDLSYERVVRLATERLSRRISLPTFEIWVTAYGEDPTRFDDELLGLWEASAPGPGAAKAP